MEYVPVKSVTDWFEASQRKMKPERAGGWRWVHEPC